MNINDLKNSLAREIYGMTREEALKKGLCLHCKKKATWYSTAGEREYWVSALCESCFDKLAQEI